MDVVIGAENGPPGNYALQPGTSQAAGRKYGQRWKIWQTVGNGGTQSHRD